MPIAQKRTHATNTSTLCMSVTLKHLSWGILPTINSKRSTTSDLNSLQTLKNCCDIAKNNLTGGGLVVFCWKDETAASLIQQPRIVRLMVYKGV